MMQLHLVQYVIAMAFFTYHTSSALVATFQFPANHNQTVAQALIASPDNQTNLTEADFWPVKDNYWLEIDTSNIYMDLKYVHSVLKRADVTLGKRPAGQTITGVLSVTADRTIEPHNEAEFVFTAIEGHEVTLADAIMSATGLNSWYQSEPLIERRYATYFYLTEQGAEGRGKFGYGALKRTWQPFPPRIAGNASVSR